jgi:predicted flavoprotein YhiN
MAADVLLSAGVSVDIYEAKPSVGRKFLMAGKGGLNITHSEPFNDFIGRYDKPEWLEPMVDRFDANAIRHHILSVFGIKNFFF